MTLRTRRLLYFFFIFIFITVTPLISLYASGYKLGKGFKIEKTGILILNSEPAGAKIYINNKIQRSFFKNLYNPEQSYILTPAKLKNILPGTHTIKIEHENYWHWQKKLEIRPGKSTFAENISLFKKDIPLKLVSGSFNNSLFSKNNKVLLANKTQLRTFDLKKEEVISENIFPEDKQEEKITWSPNNMFFLKNNTLYKLNSDKKQYEITKTFPSNTKKIQFDYKNDDNIFYQTQNSIAFLDLNSQEVTILNTNKNVKNFLVKDEKMFLIEQNQISTKLIIIDIASKKINKQISIPSSDYTFLHSEHKLINLFDKKHDILYIINPDAPIKQLLETINNCLKTNWIDDNRLLFANNFEIWTLNISTLKRTLITRISDKIEKTIWHPNDNYILYSTNKSINIIELDDRDRYNTTKLLEVNKIKNPYLNEQGDVLYFLAHIGNQEGLYKLLIQ